MRLCDILSPQRIKVPLTAGTKEGVIAELVDVLCSNGDAAGREAVLSAVMDRERTRTTGIGSAIAIPHGRCTAVKSLVMAVGRTASPVDFNSTDGRPVSLVVLLVCPPEKTADHIQGLAKACGILSLDSVRNRLLAADTPDAVYQAMLEGEQANA